MERALVLSGGGGKGAYQVGVLKALSEYGIDKEIKAFSGASIGAINAALIQTENINNIVKIWMNVEVERIIRRKKSFVDRVLREEDKLNYRIAEKLGFFSRSGLVKKLESLDMDKILNSRNETYISVVDITDISEKDREEKAAKGWFYGEKIGETKYMYLKNYCKKEIIDILLASSAIPILFKPVEIHGRIYIDGGINQNIPMDPLYNMGYTQIIVISCNQIDEKKLKFKYPNAEIKVFQPSRYLGNMFTGTLNFNKISIKKRMNLGYYDAMYNITKW